MRTVTTNGMEALTSTNNSNVDLFFSIGSSRNAEEAIVNTFKKALKVDPKTATAILCWARDIRGGAGERKTFRKLLKVLAAENPDMARRVLNIIA